MSAVVITPDNKLAVRNAQLALAAGVGPVREDVMGQGLEVHIGHEIRHRERATRTNPPRPKAFPGR